MKKLSTLHTLKLILLVQILTIILTIFLMLYMGQASLAFAENNIIFNLFKISISVFISINIFFINQNFKKSAIYSLIYTGLTLILFIINFPIFEKTSILNIFVYIVDIAIFLINLISTYYYYKGFYMLCDTNDEKNLCNKWSKLLIMNITITIITFIMKIVFTETVLQFLASAIILILLFMMVFIIFMGIVEITEFIYLIKTIKALRRNNTQ